MKRIIFLALMTGSIAGGCLWLPLWAVSLEAGGEIDIVVNRSNSLSDLSIDEARRIFLCDKSSWPNGKHISVLMLVPGQPERATVVRAIYKMSESDYAKYFLQAAFTGRIPAPPKEIGSPAQMKQMLSQNPSAIGYLKKEDVDDSVKVILRLP